MLARLFVGTVAATIAFAGFVPAAHARHHAPVVDPDYRPAEPIAPPTPVPSASSPVDDDAT